MKNFTILAALLLSTAVWAGNEQATAQERVGFTENKGQVADDGGHLRSEVLFKVSGVQPGIYITTSGITYVFPQRRPHATEEGIPADNQIEWSKLTMRLEGAQLSKENIVTEDALPGVSNYYYAHCPQGVLNVKTYRTVTIKSVYPGIDWVLKADATGKLSHDFIVHPGADPLAIKLFYEGASSIKAENDMLLFQSKYGSVQEGQLNVYQGTQKVSAKFMNKNNRISVKVADYNRKCTLVIDPPLQWSQMQISSGADIGYAVTPAHDGSGDVCLVGTSDGSDFPMQNAAQGTFGGQSDMVIVRLTSNGARIWSTYYGGTGYEEGKGIASDYAGNVYVTGYTGSSVNFPTLNPLQANYGGGMYDMAIVKFNSAGACQRATWYGGVNSDFGMAMTCTGSGDVYITGYTGSSNFPTLTAIQSSKSFVNDAFIVKLNSALTVQWATFYGGDDDDKGRAITLDPSNSNVYITGSTVSGTFPNTTGGFQANSASAYNAEDAFIVKMSTSQVVQFATYCGGSDADFGQGIAVDNAGDIFITGYTLSFDFPIVNAGGSASYIDSTQGSPATHDAFIVQCSSNGATRNWSTYFGGSSTDLALAVACNNTGNLFIAGYSASTDLQMHLPADAAYYHPTQSDGGLYNDIFITGFLISDHSLQWSTYYGNTDNNEAHGLACDSIDNIYVTGNDSMNMAALKFAHGIFTSTNSATATPFSIHSWPDPATSELNVALRSDQASMINVSITNEIGQLLQTESWNAAAGENRYTINVQHLPAGIYFLRADHNGTSEVHRFVKH